MTREQLKQEVLKIPDVMKALADYNAVSREFANHMVDLIKRQDAYIDELQRELTNTLQRENTIYMREQEKANRLNKIREALGE